MDLLPTLLGAPMMYDAGDGTTGRRVWRVTIPGHQGHAFVIAATADAARGWLDGQYEGAVPDGVKIDDCGSADRTEIAVWKDETRL